MLEHRCALKGQDRKLVVDELATEVFNLAHMARKEDTQCPESRIYQGSPAKESQKLCQVFEVTEKGWVELQGLRGSKD